MDWLELSICNWGYTKDFAKPTVRITAENKTDGDWGSVCRGISRIGAVSGLQGLQDLQVGVEERELF